MVTTPPLGSIAADPLALLKVHCACTHWNENKQSSMPNPRPRSGLRVLEVAVVGLCSPGHLRTSGQVPGSSRASTSGLCPLVRWVRIKLGCQLRLATEGGLLAVPGLMFAHCWSMGWVLKKRFFITDKTFDEKKSKHRRLRKKRQELPSVFPQKRRAIGVCFLPQPLHLFRKNAHDKGGAGPAGAFLMRDQTFLIMLHRGKNLS